MEYNMTFLSHAVQYAPLTVDEMDFSSDIGFTLASKRTAVHVAATLYCGRAAPAGEALPLFFFSLSLDRTGAICYNEITYFCLLGKSKQKGLDTNDESASQMDHHLRARAAE
jgi:hypothetical protein